MFIKLCGLRRLADVEAARALAVSAIGINLVASSRRSVSIAQASALAEAAAELRVFFVIDGQPPDALFSLLKSAPSSVVQRTDAGWMWPKAIRIAQRAEVVRLAHARDVDAAESLSSSLIISDAPASLGGSGRRADWALSASLAKRREVILAGGLTAENVAEAIRAVQPFGVDVASGIEEAGQVSEARMRAFVAAARGAT
jgi:phosphoribosylanthranilate isomerase